MPTPAPAPAFDTSPQAAREAALDAADPETRLSAIAHLGQQADPEALRTLVAIIQDPDPHMRQSALDALGPLVHQDPQVRQALARVRQTAADPAIRQLLTDSLATSAPDMPDAAAPTTTQDTDR